MDAIARIKEISPEIGGGQEAKFAFFTQQADEKRLSSQKSGEKN